MLTVFHCPMHQKLIEKYLRKNQKCSKLEKGWKDNDMMTDTFTVTEIGGRKCHIFRNGCESRKLPVFYWGIMPDNAKTVRTVASYLKERTDNADFLLTAYESDNWNDDFSPWKAPPVFGTQGFGGGADRTLEWLTDCCIPSVESAYIKGAGEIRRFPAGYSLAGLFSLWAFCESDVFAGAVSCSGSLWYDGIMEYMRGKEAAFDRDGSGCIYLSLGEQEERTKQKRMAAVGDNTREVYGMLCENHQNLKCTLEWNRGGHFSETDVRMARGISWVLQKIDF